MAERTIVEYPHPALRRRCAEVTSFDATLATLLDDMRETMDKANGIGLAANQVAVPLRAFTMVIPGASEDDPGEFVELVNPVIVGKRGEVRNEEGCLSFPELYEAVLRAAEVDVQYDDRNGVAHRRTFAQIAAVCVQHEIDHLDGVTFVDRLSPLKRRLALRAFQRAQLARQVEAAEDRRAAVRGRA